MISLLPFLHDECDNIPHGMFPRDVLGHLISYLSATEAAQVGLVSRFWYHARDRVLHLGETYEYVVEDEGGNGTYSKTFLTEQFLAKDEDLLPYVHTLRLECDWSKLGPETVIRNRFAKMTQLKCLDLKQMTKKEEEEKENYSSGAADTVLKEISKLTTITSLDIDKCVSCSDRAVSQMISGLTHLTSLTVTNMESLAEDSFREIGNLTDLTELDFGWYDGLTENGLRLMTSNTRQLTSLRMNSCPDLTPSCVQEMMSKLTMLQTLSMRSMGSLTDKHMINLPLLTHLTDIDCSSCSQLTDASFLRLPLHMKTLTLSNVPHISDNAVCTFETLSCLTTLDLSWSNVSDVGMSAIAKLHKLTNLYLSGCKKITHEGFRAIASSLTSLVTLFVGYADTFTNECLAEVKKFPLLDTLYISGCEQVDDAGTHEIAQMSHLTYLNVSQCNITDVGLGQISKLSPCLTSLIITNNDRISDVGLDYLTGMENLRWLEVSYCSQITDAGVMHISKLKKLKTLEISGCSSITESGKDAIRAVATLEVIEQNYY